MPLATIGAIVILCVSVHAHYPIQKWLFWTYARSWLCALYFAIACMSAGRLAVRHLFRLQLAADERLIFSFWTGVLAFFLAMFVGGLLGLYGAVFALLMPLSIIAPLVPTVVSEFKDWWFSSRRFQIPALPRTTWALPVAAFGFVGVGMLYFGIATYRSGCEDATP